ncbi:hypothetical protein M413DRAFT_63436 [Hebeloma cylindrosporum]|uniref:Peptidase M43 pregnancy-associated plasma-A domain-containing protein n=1 Tax=Hebeloma cylindrosporum TaxID=76867 RepID=A0A0C3CSC7_HEBCY|nr:hypothetical protein M413DRAFT_63436 [Hebeloma cylindrosporum h7]
MSENSPSSNSTTIQTHFHIIAANETEEGGWIPEPQLTEQLRVINDDFNSTGISFNRTSVERVINEEWFSNGGPETKVQDEMKQHLRKGGASDLNVYFVDFAGDWEGLLGYSTFPITYNNNSIDDGVVILYSTVPGGTTSHFNLGRSLTHEVGHWLGLYHTFQNGCDNPGDYVSDTPDQATPTTGCPSSRDTCSSEGVDPIHNFMDYSDDSCMNNFTPTQAVRIKSQIITYRNIRF